MAERFWQRWLGGLGGLGGERVAGRPPSANGASSLHLRWAFPASAPPLVSVAVTLEVLAPPTTPDLHFWAVQASFVDRGRSSGAAHLGLQWHAGHPASRAVNWGGYASDGAELEGSASALTSATGNRNTHDFPWQERRPHRLVIAPGGRPGDWRGSVDGVVVRDLYAGGAALAEVVMWSEVFAPCEGPSTAVRWSAMSATTADGTDISPDRLVAHYQRDADGGCANTDVVVDGDGFIQVTATSRTTPAGAFLTVAR